MKITGKIWFPGELDPHTVALTYVPRERESVSWYNAEGIQTLYRVAEVLWEFQEDNAGEQSVIIHLESVVR